MECRKVKTAILICSDRASAGKYEDKTGPKLKNEITEGMTHIFDLITVRDCEKFLVFCTWVKLIELKARSEDF